MRRHPPPDEKKKRSRCWRSQGPLTVDEQNNALTSPDRAKPALTRPPFIFAQHTQNDKANEPGCFVVSVQCKADYIPTDSPGQIFGRTIQNQPESILANLDVLVVRERKAKDEADQAGDDDAFLASFDRLLCLYESYFEVRGTVEHGS